MCDSSYSVDANEPVFYLTIRAAPNMLTNDVNHRWDPSIHASITIPSLRGDRVCIDRSLTNWLHCIRIALAVSTSGRAFYLLVNMQCTNVVVERCDYLRGRFVASDRRRMHRSRTLVTCNYRRMNDSRAPADSSICKLKIVHGGSDALLGVTPGPAHLPFHAFSFRMSAYILNTIKNAT